MAATHRQLLASVLLSMLALASPTAHAGRSCETRPVTTQSLERGLSLARQTAMALNATDANVVLLARAGQDLTQYRLKWSHLGWAYRTQDAEGQSVWRVVHKLNTCGTREAAVYRQGLGEFFLDDPWRYEAAWAIPSQAVQDQLLPLLQNDTRATALHQAPYSIVSYAWSQKYQQSNQWAIETLAAAMETGITKTTSAANITAQRQRAQAWLQYKGYEPTALNIGPFTRLGGRMGAANVAFDDHPNEKRYADRIETITADSVFAWMQRSDLGSAPQRLQLRFPMPLD
jgi:hypothetical protein